MKNTMKLRPSTKLSIFGAVALAAAFQVHAQNAAVTVDPAQIVNGYMSWSPAAGDATGYGGSGGGSWGFADLQASFSGSTLTLNPNINTYDNNLTTGPSGGPNPYWINADGSGANIMDASSYADASAASLGVAGGNLTFTYDVLANNLTTGYTADAWIKVFDQSYAFLGESATVPLTVGAGSVSFAIPNVGTDRVQYGFELIGPNAAGGSAAALTSVSITPQAVPEPSTLALAGMGGMGLLSLLRRRKK